MISPATDSDPTPIVSDKKTNPWFQFVARVRTITGLTQPEAMKLASSLRAEKAIETWTDTEISPRGVRWLRENYMLMTPQLLQEKLRAVAALEEVRVRVAGMAEDLRCFIEGMTASGNPSLIAATTDLNIYYTTTVPKLLDDASAELFKTAAQEDAYETAIEIPESITEKMTEITALEKSLQAKETEKEAAKATKEAEKAAAKAAKEAEKEKAKAAKEVEKAAKEAEKATAKTTKASKKVAPAGGAGEPPVIAVAVSAPSPAEVAEPTSSSRKAIPKHVKTLVWNKHIGAAVNSSKCMSCREELISIRNFHCGHVIAEAKGGDYTINNLRPICAACNGSMGTMSMNEFTKTYFGWEV